MKKIILSLFVLAFFLNSANAAVVRWASINWWSVTWENTLVEWWTHNWENIKNEDCLKNPEKCKADIPDLNAGIPEFKSAGPSEHKNVAAPKNYIKKAKKLPVTWPEEIMLILLSLLIAWWLFFILKSRKNA